MTSHHQANPNSRCQERASTTYIRRGSRGRWVKVGHLCLTCMLFIPLPDIFAGIEAADRAEAGARQSRAARPA